MKSLSGLVAYVFFGALVGALVSSWLAPKAIAWYFDPPVEMGVNCKAATEWSMARLLIAQGIGAAVGLIVGASIFFGLKGRRLSSESDV